MFKALPLVLVLVLVACSADNVDTRPSPSLKIEIGSSIGSAVKIGEGTVLTAAHVVGDHKEVMVKNENGVLVKGAVIFVDKVKDLAVIRAVIDAQSSRMACELVPVGTEFEFYGNPLGMEFVKSWGRIAAKPREHSNKNTGYIVDATLIFGNSGGGAFDHRGRVIGIASAIRVAPINGGGFTFLSISGFGILVDGPTICDFLRKNKVNFRQ